MSRIGNMVNYNVGTFQKIFSWLKNKCLTSFYL